jgi:F-type H+-transporting ATPase subunit a
MLQIPIFTIFLALLNPLLHLYFDLFDGGIQALIFALLTIVY